MKIIINSYNRPDTISTPALLDRAGLEYTVVLHSPEQYELYKAYGKLGKANVIVANQPVGMVNIRNWVIENLVSEGEWFLHLDDNITAFQAVPMPYYNEPALPVKTNPAKYKSLFENEIDAGRFIEICEEAIELADKTGVKLVGFASNKNHYFRERKWREVGYVIGKTQLIRKTGLRYDRNVFATDDYLWTALNLEAFGKVLINNYAIAVKKHYSKGGIGEYEDRLRWKLPDVEYLMQRFEGLFRYKIKAGCHPKAEIQVRFTSTKQVEEWRAFIRAKHAKETSKA